MVDSDLKIRLIDGSCFGQPTLMFRRSSLIKNNLKYDEEIIVTEDYDLWVRAAIKGLKFANLNEYLLHYRLHETQISARKEELMKESTIQIQMKYLKFYFSEILSNDDIMSIINNFRNLKISDSICLINKLHKYNLKKKHFDILEFEYFLRRKLDNSLPQLNIKDIIQIIKARPKLSFLRSALGSIKRNIKRNRIKKQT